MPRSNWCTLFSSFKSIFQITSAPSVGMGLNQNEIFFKNSEISPKKQFELLWLFFMYINIFQVVKKCEVVSLLYFFFFNKFSRWGKFTDFVYQGNINKVQFYRKVYNNSWTVCQTNHRIAKDTVFLNQQSYHYCYVKLTIISQMLLLW